MKLTLSILALVAFANVPAFADDAVTKSLGGCLLVDKGGYNVKADPTCAFDFADDGQEDRELADTDGDPSTPSERVGL